MLSRPGRMPAAPALPLGTAGAPQTAGNGDVAWPEPANPGENLFTQEEWQVLGRAFDFSERELAVAILLVEGLSREEIGMRLRKQDGSGLSTWTVRAYVDRIFDKVQVQDRLGLVLRLVRAYRRHIGR